MANKKAGALANRQTTSASQNACRRRNTGTSAVPRPVDGHYPTGWERTS
jgi:hypothetical protein